jgi:hypothetical protein
MKAEITYASNYSNKRIEELLTLDDLLNLIIKENNSIIISDSNHEDIDLDIIIYDTHIE